MRLNHNILLISKIYKNFEKLEAELRKMQLEEPLFMIGIAKQSFSDAIFSRIKQQREKTTPVQ